MKKSSDIELTIETPIIGDVFLKIPYHCEDDDNENSFVIAVPNQRIGSGRHTKVDLSMIVAYDIKYFKELNSRSDDKHQIYIDTLCIYGVKIRGNYIRVQYWFNQDGDVNSHRMCAGRLTHCPNISKYSFDETPIRILPECYSTDVCVYW